MHPHNECKLHHALLLQLHACELVLEQEGVWGYVTTEEFQMDFIPLDKDILSLELPEFFSSVFLVRIISHTSLINMLRYVVY